MNLHSLKNTKGARRPRRRIGRGESSGSGKTAGRGMKGQKSRSGYSRKATFEGGQMPLVRRVPKRGFRHVRSELVLPVNVGDLNRFDDGAEVTLDALRTAGLARGPIAGVKILGTGELTRKLTVRARAFSGAARTKIEAAGGRCEVIS
ncbi:MAG: 50S ribosomal protein L15 [Kiritimatiellae bacterium]|nr:50S ribosomal protein L15 [Kiritimatiellia bacterium]